MNRNEKVKMIAQPRSIAAEDRAKELNELCDRIEMSQEIALSLLYYLKKAKKTQKVFAKELGVSPAYVGKIVRGNENLTLQTICKMQNVLGKRLISVERPYMRSAVFKTETMNMSFESVVESNVYRSRQHTRSYSLAKYGSCNTNISNGR